MAYCSYFTHQVCFKSSVALLMTGAVLQELKSLIRHRLCQACRVHTQHLTKFTGSHELTYGCQLQINPDLNRASPPVDDWELEPSEIAFQEKIASGAFGDLYKGAYCGQDVAIKIVRNVQDNTQQFQEFIQASLRFSKGHHRLSMHIAKLALAVCSVSVCRCSLHTRSQCLRVLLN